MKALQVIAVVVALCVALAAPLGYFAVSYGNLAASNRTRASFLAEAVNAYLVSDPLHWRFQEYRISEILERHVQAHDGGGLYSHVADARGTRIAHVGAPQAKPVMTRSALLYDSGVPAGRVEIQQSLLPTLARTAIAGLIGLALGMAVFATLRLLPLRALRRVTYALAQEMERAQVTLRSIGDAVISTGTALRIEYMNPAAERLTGWTLAEARGRALHDVVRLTCEMGGDALACPAAAALAGNCVLASKGHALLARRDGERIAVEHSAAPIRNADGAAAGAVLVLHDVSNAQRLAQRLSYQASHDVLTGLLNRSEFERRVDEALESACAQDKSHAVCYLDLDQFKLVNDTCGHAAGDELLRTVAKRLQAETRASDALARLGGDEFALLLYGCSIERARAIAEGLLESIRQLRFRWGERVFTVAASIGVVPLTGSATHGAEIMSAVDAACYLAKRHGRDRVQVHTSEDGELARQRGEMDSVSMLTHALEKNRFTLHYQSIVPLRASGEHGQHFEVLLRLTAADGQAVSPGAFIPAAERYNLMPQIDRWVVREVFGAYARLVAAAPAPIETISVNLSGTSLGDARMLDYILAQARRHGVAPQHVCFELTETAALANLQTAACMMRALKAEGFRLAIDDFGSGFTSFSYLKNLPLDFLKIDGSFVATMLEDHIDHATVSTLNHLGHVVGVRTVAEWVDSPRVLAELQRIGVDYAQGFGVARPRPLAELFTHWPVRGAAA